MLVTPGLVELGRKKKPLLAQPVKGTSVDGVLNETTGELRNPKGQKIKRNTVTLENGMTLSFDSDRELTPDELQETVNQIAAHPDFVKQEKAITAKRKQVANTPASEVGPYDTRRVKAQKKEQLQSQLAAEQGRMADIAANRLRPNNQGDTGFDLSPEGIAQSFQRIAGAVPKAADALGLLMQGLVDPNVKPDSFDMREGVSDKGRAQMNPSAKITSAATNVGSYFVPGLGALQGAVQGINMGGRVAQGEGQQVLQEAATGLNIFDPKIDPVERGVRAINVLGTIYGGYQVAKGVSKLTKIADVSRQLKVNPLQAEQIVNWAEEASARAPKRTGINKAGRDDAKGTGAAIALGNYEAPVAAGKAKASVPLPTVAGSLKPELKPAPKIQIPGQAEPQVQSKPVEAKPKATAFTNDPVTIAQAKFEYIGLLAENMQRFGNPDPNLISFRYVDDFINKVAQKYNVDPKEVGKGMATLQTMHANGMQEEIANFAKKHGGEYENYLKGDVKPASNSQQGSNLPPEAKLGTLQGASVPGRRTPAEVAAARANVRGVTPETKALPGRTPEVAPKAKTKLPDVRENYPRPLKDFGDTFYHETSPANAEANPKTYAGQFLSNNPDLALGQSGKGVTLEYQPGKVVGQVNKQKPTWEYSYQNGDAEFVVGNAPVNPELPVAYRIKPGVKMPASFQVRMETAIKNGSWAKETLPDGSTRYYKVQEVAPKVEAAPKATPKPAPVETSPNISATTAKEPWQMTQQEVVKEGAKNRIKRSQNEPVFVRDKETGKTVAEIKRSQASKLNTQKYEVYEQGGQPLSMDDPAADNGWVGNVQLRHKQFVESALKEGKPVPAEVLKDYPDLAAKYKPTEAPAPVAKVETPKVVKTRDVMRDSMPSHAMPDTPEMKLAWIREHGEIASDTNRRLRYVFELSDGRKVSMEGVVRNTNPELWSNIKENAAYYRSAKGRGELFDKLPKEAQSQLLDLIPAKEIADKWDSPLYKSKGNPAALEDWLKENAHPLAGTGHPSLKRVREEIYRIDLNKKRAAAGLDPADVTRGHDLAPKTGLDAAYEQAVANRKKGGTGNKNRQRGAAENPAQALADYAVIAAYHIRNGARSATDILKRLIAENPEDERFIRSNFSQIVAKSREHIKPNEAKVSTGIETPAATKAAVAGASDAPSPAFPAKAPSAIQKPTGAVNAESVGVKSAKLKGTQPAGRLDGFPPVIANGKVEPTPAKVPAGETPTRFAASNAASNDVREAIGVDKLPDADKRKWDEVLTSATKTYDGDAIDARIKDVSKPLSDVETAQAAMRSAELSKKLKAATGETYDELESKLLEHTIALRNAGTEQGRALAARNAAVLEDYSLDGMYRRYVGASKAKSASDIPADVRQTIKRLSESHDTLQTRITELQKKFDEQATKLAEAERVRMTQEIKTRGTRKAATKATRDELIHRIRKNQSQYISSVPVQGLIDSADDIKALVKLTLEDGITDLSEVYKAVAGDLKKGGVDLTRSEFDGVLAGAYKKTPGLKRDLTEYQKLLKAAKESGAGKDALIWQRVRRLDERIKAQQFDSLKTTPIGKALTDAEIALKAKQVEFDRLKTQAKVKAEFDALSQGGKAWRSTLEVANAVRSVVASTDVSAPLNQGFFYTLSHPGKSASAMWETMGAIKGDDALNAIMGKVRNNRYYELGKGSKLQVGAAAGDYADDFMTFGNSKAAKVLTGKYSPIGASERVYKAYVTKIRMDMFADLAKAEERAAGGRLKRSDYEAIAEFVNTVTGTTTNKTVQNVSKEAGVLLFAPKYTVSRIKTAFATPAINAARVGNYRLAGRILGEYAKVAAAIGGAIYVANKNGANVELDPRSPKFMKGRIGNVEFNADQGLGQSYKILAQVLNPALDRIPGLPKVTGKKSSSYGALDTYVSGKLAPGPKMLKNVIDGKAYGKSYDVAKQEGWVNLGLAMLPISVQNGADLSKRTDISNEQKAAIGLAAFLGVKIDAEPPRAK